MNERAFPRTSDERTAIAAAGGGVPQGTAEKADEMLLGIHQHLQEALRIPTMPWPDPGAHGHEATARAIHTSYCALRFKVMDAIAELNGARVELTGLLASSPQPEAAQEQLEKCGNRDYCGRFPFCGCGGPEPLPERDTSKPAEQQGLFRKFDVRRTDGSDKPGGKHYGCEYFVLDVPHDKHAKAALAAYAAAVEETNPHLAQDMRDRYELSTPAQPEAAPAVAQVPFAYSVYFPDQQRGELVHDLDELCDDMTNDENHEVTKLYAAPEAPAKAAPSAGEVERGDVVAFEFYNRATGHAIVDYSVNTHVGNLSAAKGYEARPLVYADKREEVTDGSKPIPLWQAREALDELEAAARGDAPFNHQAAAVVRAALSHKEPQR